MFIFAYMDFKYQLNWQFSDTDLEQTIDPALFAILYEIQQRGSLKQAAEQVGVSYRHAWGLLNKWQQQLAQLVVLEPGRGAYLSAVGEKLLSAHQQLTARFSPELDNFATEFKRELTNLIHQANSQTLNIFASHGLAISALRQSITQQTDFDLDLHFHGSLACLRALKLSECDIAGFHIPVGTLAKPLYPQYLEILSPETHQLIYVVKRNQGLMYKPNNTQNITGLSSLQDRDLRFVNRQVDSGTRLLFDQLIESEQISKQSINGYDHEEFTHMAVAALIASDAADVGFGIAAVADEFNLEFIPLVWEHYCLAVPNAIANDPRVHQIIELLKGELYQHTLANISGYQTELSGQIVDFKTIFDS